MKSISGKVCWLLLLTVFTFKTNLFAQNSNYKLEFKNGTSIFGQIIKQTDDSLTIKTNDGNVYKYMMTDLKVVSPSGYVEPKPNSQEHPIIDKKKEKNKFPISVGLNINYNNTSLNRTRLSPIMFSSFYTNSASYNSSPTFEKFKNNNIGIQFNFIKGISNKFDINAGFAYTKYSYTLVETKYLFGWTTTSRELFIKYISIPINLSFYNKQRYNGFYCDFGINPQLFTQIIDMNSKEPLTKELRLNKSQYRVISFNSLLGVGYYFKLNNDLKIKSGLNYTMELLEFNISYFRNTLSKVSNKHNFYPTLGINYTINKK
jgi:hypothetical protein